MRADEVSGQINYHVIEFQKNNKLVLIIEETKTAI